MFSWGWSGYNQLATTESGDTNVPRLTKLKPSNGYNVTQIAAGYGWAIALLSMYTIVIDGRQKCRQTGQIFCKQNYYLAEESPDFKTNFQMRFFQFFTST